MHVVLNGQHNTIQSFSEGDSTTFHHYSIYSRIHPQTLNQALEVLLH